MYKIHDLVNYHVIFNQLATHKVDNLHFMLELIRNKYEEQI